MKPAAHRSWLVPSAAFLLALLTCLAAPLRAQAIPPLPSSFYGTVQIDGGSIPDGTRITAWINGHEIASGLSQTYQGESVYSLDVLGDDPDSPAVEGGRDGIAIQFKIGDLNAGQIGSWHSGTNVHFDLTSSARPTPTRTLAQDVESGSTAASPAPNQVNSAPAEPKPTGSGSTADNSIELILATAAAAILVLWIVVRRKRQPG
jgi:hypothetical protein